MFIALSAAITVTCCYGKYVVTATLLNPTITIRRHAAMMAPTSHVATTPQRYVACQRQRHVDALPPPTRRQRWYITRYEGHTEALLRSHNGLLPDMRAATRRSNAAHHALLQQPSWSSNKQCYSLLHSRYGQQREIAEKAVSFKQLFQQPYASFIRRCPKPWKIRCQPTMSPRDL